MESTLLISSFKRWVVIQIVTKNGSHFYWWTIIWAVAKKCFLMADNNLNHLKYHSATSALSLQSGLCVLSSFFFITLPPPRHLSLSLAPLFPCEGIGTLGRWHPPRRSGWQQSPSRWQPHTGSDCSPAAIPLQWPVPDGDALPWPWHPSPVWIRLWCGQIQPWYWWRCGRHCRVAASRMTSWGIGRHIWV